VRNLVPLVVSHKPYHHFYASSPEWPLPPPSVASLLTVKIRQPSHEFTFGVGMTFVSYPLVLTPVV
jgi:hypothetical protein